MSKLDDLVAALRTVATLAHDAADELEVFAKGADMPAVLRVGDPSMHDLVTWTANALCIGVAVLIGPSRTRPLTPARHCAMAAIRKSTDYSLATIADAFGGRNHATVAAAVARCESDPRMALVTEQLVDVIAQRSGRTAR